LGMITLTRVYNNVGNDKENKSHKWVKIIEES